MSENAKTITFVVVGMVAVLAGLLSRPSSAELDENSLVNTDLTKKFTNVEDAKRLRIVRVNEDTATRSEFEVAEQNGLWTIPSKDGYPADAAAQMAEAATSLMDRKILGVASKSASDHEEYGVIDPSSPKLEPGQKGVGTRVTMFNEQKDPLVDLIVGKAVKGAEGQRYVREAGRDIVYVIEIDRSKLSTNFEDWIEKDLLKLNSWDLQQVDIKDYSAALVRVMSPEGPSIGIDRDDRAELSLTYNDSDGKWTPEKLRSFDRAKGENGEYVDFTLAADEELNNESLNGLKTALDDLKIVDVVRKPAGLSADLKAGADFVNNEAAFMDLISKGFTATGMGEGAPQDIISSDGEVVATMKNGAEYVLRFGNLTNVSGSGEQKDDAAPATPADAAAAAAAAADKKTGSDVHRYMFVMARHNKAAVKQPELKPLPPAAEEAKPAAEATPGAAAADASAPASPPPAEGAAATPPAEPGAETPPADATKAEAPKADEAKADEPKADETKDAKAEQPADTSAADAKDAAKAEAPADAAPADKAKELEKVMAERKKIEEENQRKMDEYQELVKKGEETVKELNLRFGDWYFVVDDDVFQKIRLGREDVVKKKEPPKTEGAAPPAGAATPAPPANATPAGLPEVPGAKE
jgi:hypothetical protein